MAKKNVPSNKGYDPYNKPTASKPKPKPNPNKASPNNPYNNAGAKIKASSRGPTSFDESFGRGLKSDNSIRAYKRAAARQMALNPGSEPAFKYKSNVDRASSEASKGMWRKNAARKATVDAARRARPSKIGWAKVGGAAKGSAVKWGTAGAKKAAPAMLGGYLKGIASTAGAAVGRSLGPIGAVVGAGQVGYEIGKAANKKWNISGRIVDALSPSYDPNSTGRSRTLTKSGSYDNPALQRHHAKKKKR